MGGSDNTGEGLAHQPRRCQVPGQPLLNRHQVGGVSHSPGGLFAQHEEEPTMGRRAVRGKGTIRAPQTTPNTHISTHLGAPRSPPPHPGSPQPPQPHPVCPCISPLCTRNRQHQQD